MLQYITAAEFKDFIRIQDEKDYLIVDIRSDKEYGLDHIPGAVNIPLAKIQSGDHRFEGDQKLVFCCRSGRRSKVAAILVSETGYDEDKLYNLAGGVQEYTGEILLEYPKIEVFPSDFNSIELMKRSLDLEKGAFKFYSIICEKLRIKELRDVAANMARAEISHAKSIFNSLTSIFELQMNFDEFFDLCEGNILEGGKSIEVIQTLFDGNASVSCIDILDFAVELEYCAYDLYKVTATRIKEENVQKMFYKLAQAEKKHLQEIINSFDLCDVIA